MIRNACVWCAGGVRCDVIVMVHIIERMSVV